MSSRSIIVTHVSLIAGALTAAGEEKVSYDDHIFPLFEQSCLNCHNPDKTKGGLDLSSYSGAMKGGSGGKIAEAGDLDSKLLVVVRQTSEPKMPPEGDKLGDDKIALLKSWIEGGLLENQSSTAKKPSKPKFDLAMSADPTAKPDGPPPMPQHVLLEPEVVADRAAAVQAMATSPWAPLLAVTGQRQVLLFDTGGLVLAGVLPFPEGDPTSLAFTSNGRYLIVGGGIPGKSGLTATFDVTTGERLMTIAKEFDTILACDLRPELDAVATGSPSRRIKFWKTDDGSQVTSIKKHTDWVTALDFSPDGVLLATGDRNGGVWAWEAATGNEFHTLRAHQAGITAVAFRADSNVLASASEDGTVRFWEMNNGGEIRKIDAHPGGALGFSWARDGSFATCGRDGKAKLWKPDFNHRRDIGELPDLPVTIALAADGKRAFIACYNGQVLVHDVESGNRIGGFDSNPPAIETRLIALREDLDQQPQRIAEATRARDEARRLADEARLSLAALEQRRTKSDAKAAEADRLHQEKRAELDTRQAELEPLAKEHDALSQAVAEAGRQSDEKRAALASLMTSLEDARIRVTATEQDTPEFDVSQQELSDLERQHRETSEQLASLEARRQASQQQLGELNPRITGLEAQLDTTKQSVDESHRALEASKTEAEDTRKELEAKSNEFEQRRKSLEEQEARLTSETKRLEALRRDQARWASAAISTQALRTRAEAATAMTAAEDLARQFDAAQSGFQALVTSLQAARAAGEAEVHRREEGLRQAESDLMKLGKRVGEALSEADRLQREADRLQSEYRASLGRPE